MLFGALLIVQDMGLERNALMEQVYPRLKEFCRERHGLDFQVRDPRVCESTGYKAHATNKYFLEHYWL
jgi:hypothetical protein